MDIKITISIIVCALYCINTSGQEKTMMDKRDKVEKETNKFDPTYWKNDENKHLAFMLKFMQDSSFQVSDVEARSGNMPHKSKTGGQVEVTYKDNNNKVLGSYYTSDPMIVRSCETHDSSLQLLPIGTIIEVLTPYISDVHSIDLEHVYQKTTRNYLVGPTLQDLRLMVQ